ncbi:hypothetical protein F6U93_00005 [Tamlana haliotis]|uniref:Uncharacterized protein n=1 Tax=Pseudotamlana haliotis TaxID=2614804 RepID=A0A6N6MP90_9FLAO|nr:hypothetical protein [Tamlana haliotis]KAB1071864.1 hypothetical protein F6U93_00005 [Tamlana haliotis]
MNIGKTIAKLFNRKPKNPNEFVKSFIKQSKTQRVQLELIKDNEVILQVDSLKFTPSWFKLFNISNDKYQNGYVVFFVIDSEKLKTSDKYNRYKKSNLQLLELDEEIDDGTEIRTFAKFVKHTDDEITLGKIMKEILDVIIKTDENDPQALFVIREINVSG